MDVLIDTSVWSMVIRRHAPDLALRKKVDDLIAGFRVGMIGAIRQECLSGINDPKQFDRLRTFLRTFADIVLVSEDYELAASFYNACRMKGIQGSHADFLICAVAKREQLKIFTTDKDFDRFAVVIPITRFMA